MRPVESGQHLGSSHGSGGHLISATPGRCAFISIYWIPSPLCSWPWGVPSLHVLPPLHSSVHCGPPRGCPVFVKGNLRLTLLKRFTFEVSSIPFRVWVLQAYCGTRVMDPYKRCRRVGLARTECFICSIGEVLLLSLFSGGGN